MLVLNEQEEIKDKIARRVPVIARKSSQEEPPKRKRTGFLGLFGKKEEAKPTVTTSMLNTLNSDVIARSFRIFVAFSFHREIITFPA